MNSGGFLFLFCFDLFLSDEEVTHETLDFIRAPIDNKFSIPFHSILYASAVHQPFYISIRT